METAKVTQKLNLTCACAMLSAKGALLWGQKCLFAPGQC